MYIPKINSVDDPALTRELIRDNAFATLISAADTAALASPWVSHLPLLLDESAEGWSLVGHFARANGHWQAGAGKPVTAIFHGPHGYISPHWYQSPNMVPTWNYAVVHAHGTLEVQDNALAARDIVWRLSQSFEASLPQPWSAMHELDPGVEQKLLNAIVAFRIRIERLEVKVKVGQNRLPIDQQAMMRALAKDAGAVPLLALTRRVLDGAPTTPPS